ncbi:MAG: hypothetical protein PVF53_22605, partial [Desulfobacterales bacterium]
MDEEEKAAPIESNHVLRRWIKKILGGSHDLFPCFLPDTTGRLSNLLLKLFYSGIRVDESQIEIIQKLEENVLVIYVTKFKNYFEYLFYFSRYQQLGLPYPQIGFDHKVYLWQPIARLFKMLLAHLDFFTRHRRLPNPYENGYIRQELIKGRSGFLSLVGKKNFYRRFVKAKTDPIRYLIDLQKEISRPIVIIPQ